MRIEQEKNKFLGYKIEKSKITLEWKLTPYQSYSKFQGTAVRKLKKILIELLKSGEINYQYWDCSYKFDTTNNFKIITYI